MSNSLKQVKIHICIYRPINIHMIDIRLQELKVKGYSRVQLQMEELALIR